MTSIEIVRSWKDEDYLGKKDNVFLPLNPAGLIELSDEELLDSVGGITFGGGVACAFTIATLTSLVSVATLSAYSGYVNCMSVGECPKKA